MTSPGVGGDGTLAGRLDDYQPQVIGHVDVTGFPWPAPQPELPAPP